MGIAVHNIQKRFGETEALAPISLEIQRGEFVSLLGPSGCGKSTLLAMLAGLETPTEGSVHVEGPLAMVFQEAALFPWRSIRDNVAFGLEMQGVSRTERYRRAEELLAKMHLSEFARAYPYQLSGGMKQRAAIARALAQTPEILLMDEPFGALDAQTRSMLQEELLGLWQEQRPTVVFVTHDLDEALLLSTRVALFSARPGRIIEDIAVPAPYPRSLQETPELQSLRAHLRALLSAQVRAIP